MIKLILVCGALLAVCQVQFLSAIELIELTDVNKNALELELSKAVDAIQDAYKRHFEFDSVKDVEKFLFHCAYAKGVMSQSDDSAFDGLAKQVKAILSEKSIETACSVEQNAIKEGGFERMDSLDVDNYDYIKLNVFNQLVDYRKTVDSDPKLKLVLGHALDKIIDKFAHTLLTEAAGDIEAFFDDSVKPGLFDFNYSNYRKLCKIDRVGPICKLALKTDNDRFEASSSDLAELGKIIKDQPERLAEYESASKVSFETAKKNCALMLPTEHSSFSIFKPIDQIERFVEAGFLTEQEVSEYMRLDKPLNFYNELRKLCKQIA